MTFSAEIWAYLGITALLTVTPGSDVMLVIRNALSGGQLAGMRTTLGICMGLVVHAILSAAGVSLILMQSAVAFAAVKFLGAIYLMFLGGQSLWKARDNVQVQVEETGMFGVPGKDRRFFIEGFLTNLFNPKVAVFYLAFLPQFIDPGNAVLAKSLILGGTHIGMSFLWLLLLTALMGKLQHFFARPGWQQSLQTVSGLVLIGLGIRLALEQGRGLM